MADDRGAEVLLTGAAGFVGSRLWPALDSAGLRVRCVSRNAEGAARRWPERSWVQADLASRDDLARALSGCRIAYYLVHGMAEDQADFRAREVALAQVFAEEAARAGLERIVYLGGVAPHGPPSEHLASRLEVGEALRAGKVPTIELRAGMIVGAGSASWLIVRDLAARLPGMILPRWLRTLSQPVAVDDVIVALVAAARVDLAAAEGERGVWYDLPGPDVLSGKEILERTTAALGLRRPIMVVVPFLTPSLSSHWVRLVTRANWSVARELVLGLTHNLLARDDRYWGLIDHPTRLSFQQAAQRALAEQPDGGEMSRLERVWEGAVARLAPLGADPAVATASGSDGPAPGVARLDSVQEMALPPNAAAFERWGQPEGLRELVGGYFRIAERTSGELTRVSWVDNSPTVAVRWLGLPLIRMGRLAVETYSDRRVASMAILGGLIVESGAPARLSFVLTHSSNGGGLRIELTRYRPRAGHVWLVSQAYRAQEWLHARVGHRFLRLFARHWSNVG